MTNGNQAPADGGFANPLLQNAERLAKEFDFSQLGAQDLLARHHVAWESLEQLRNEIFSWSGEIWPKIRFDEQSVKRVAELLLKALLLTEHFLAMYIAAIEEIERRVQRNKTNYYFGLLMLGHVRGDISLQKQAYGELRGLLTAIARKEGWFRGEQTDWLGPVNEALAEQCNKMASLNVEAIWTRMLENGFAYVYKAAKDKMTDEVRVLVRRAPEAPVEDVSFFERLLPVSPDLEREPQRLAVLRFIQQKKLGLKREAVPQVWDVVEALLSDSDRLAEATPAEVRADAVKWLAEHRQVSERQARKDLTKFEVQCELGQEDITQLRDEVRRLGVSLRQAGNTEDE